MHSNTKITRSVDGRVFSHFLTALLMAFNDTTIQIKDELVSKPYIDITLALMHRFGVKVDHQHYCQFHIKAGQQYISPGNYLVEGDASSASYFLAAAAIKGGTVSVMGICKDSLQGDIQFAVVLKEMGVKRLIIDCLPKNSIIS